MFRTITSLARLGQRWRTGWALGLALLVVAGAFRIVEARALDSPTGREWLEVGERVLAPWLTQDGGRMAWATWLGREAEAGDWIWTLGILAANGQWDPRLGALGATLVLGVAVFLLTRVLLGGLAGGAAVGLGVAMTAVWGLPGVAHEIGGSWSGRTGWLWCLGLGHLLLTWRHPRRPWGHLCGLLAVLASTAGAASAGALVAGAWLERRRGAGRKREWTATLAWNVLLLLAAIWRGWGENAVMLPDGFALSWGGAASLLLLTAPGILLAARTLGSGDSGARDRAGPAVATFWILLLGLGVGGAGLASSPVGVAAALSVQAAAWLHLWRLDKAHRPRIALFALAWGLGTIPVSIGANRGLPFPLEITQEAQRRAEGVRAFLAGEDRADLAEALRLSRDEAARVERWLRDPRLAPWLPASVRAPLPVWDSEAAVGGFSRDGIPALPGLPAGYAAVATSGEAGVGERRSPSFATEFPFLQVYVAGVGEPGATEVFLETETGAVVRPLQTRFDASDGWRRLNLPAPRGALALAVRDTSTESWLAVSAPVELGRGTWLAGKAAEAWLALALAGALAIGAAVLAGGREAWAAWRAADPEDWRGLARWAPWAALAAYALVLSGFLDTHAAGADSAGYLAHARMLRDRELAVPMRTVPGVEASPRIYAPLGFVPREDGRLAPGYPAGLSLMIAAFACVLPFGFATALVNGLHVVGGVAVVRLLARECGLRDGWAWVAAGWVGLAPVYVFMGLQPMSDVPSLTWLSAAFLFALRARHGLGWALACGAATAMAVLLRPANALAFVPLVVALGSVRAVAGWILGAVPGAVWHGWHAWKLYGSPLATGYGDMSGAFGWQWVGPTLRHYFGELPVNFTPLVALAFVAPFLPVATRRVRWALALWAGLFLLFYAGYFFTHLAWWYQRFLVPAYPALAILALLAMQAWAERRGLRLFARGGGARAFLAGAALVAVLAVPAAVQGRRLLVLYPADGNSRYTELSRWAEASLPADAAVFAFEASTALFHHTGFTVLRFDQVEREENERVAARLLEAGRPVYAVVFHLAEQAEINRHLPSGEWRRVHRLGHMEVRQLAALTPSTAVRTAED